MAIRVNPKLIKELEKYGAADVSNCYHCGNCSAACPFSKDPYVIPRRSMRHLQMGLEDKLRDTLEPWLCYYCGECSTQCPRGAEPGETMMSLRRWLTSRYDFTGISRLFYRSWKAELAALILVSLATAVGFLMMGLKLGGGNFNVYAGAGALFPPDKVHYIDLALAGFLASLLAINSVRMWWFTTGRNPALHPPLWSYVRNLFLLPMHFLSQVRYSKCEKKSPWVFHLAIFLGWVTMEILIVFFLHRMHEAETIWTAHAFGYVATIGLLGGVTYAMIGRLRKRESHYKHTHATDLIFLILIAGTAATGILQHISYRLFGMDAMANVAYLVHMMFVVPLLGIQLPFSKLSHLAYRPLAMYLVAVHRDALARRQVVEVEPGTAKVAA
ncbi:MAG: 4Fe-4S dicluster domain-containing protein [Pseudomonadota bacterium]